MHDVGVLLQKHPHTPAKTLKKEKECANNVRRTETRTNP